MNIKYRNKVYSSDNVPLFVFFKTNRNRREFITVLSEYKLGTYREVDCMHAILAGSVLVKDKRAKIYFSIDNIDEKKTLQKNLFDNDVNENNAMLCSPGDINENVLIDWIDKNVHKLA